MDFRLPEIKTPCGDRALLNNCADEARKPKEVHEMNDQLTQQEKQPKNDEASDHFDWVRNAYPVPDNEERNLLRQRFALSALNRFHAAERIDLVCAAFGWMLTGPGDLQEQIGDDCEGAEVLDYGFSFEWANPNLADHIVRLELGDVPMILVQRHYLDEWELVEGCWALVSIVGEWAEQVREARP